jgi:hypothetical protein
MTSGGSVSIAMAIARYVDPQRTYTAASASTIRADDEPHRGCSGRRRIRLSAGCSVEE